MNHPFLATFAFAVALPLAALGVPQSGDSATNAPEFSIEALQQKAAAAINDSKSNSDFKKLHASVVTQWEERATEIICKNTDDKKRCLSEVKSQPAAKRPNRLQKEFNRYKLRERIGVDGEEFLGEKLTADAFYEIEVRPNFRNGEQIRRDIYVLGLGTTTTFGVKAEARVTFTRIFKGANAKWDAIWTKPYWINRIPMNAGEFRSGDLAAGDSVRVEFFGRAGFGKGDSSVSDKWKTNVGVGVHTEAIFMIDAYKHSNELVRVKAVALRNLGTISGNAGVKYDPGFKPVGFLRRYFTVKFGVEAQKSVNLIDDYPVKTMMADYVFNFSAPGTEKENATAALDGLFGRVKKFGFSTLFDPRRSDDEIADDLMKQASLAEKLALEDLTSRPPSERRVRHIFKGRMASTIASGRIGGQVSDLAKAYTGGGTVSSFVKSFDEKGASSYHLLENSFSRAEGRFVFGRWEDERVTDYDLILTSNEKAEPGEMTDLIVRYEAKEKTMTSDEINTVRRKLLSSLPDGFSDNGAIARAFPNKDQTNATLVYQYSFGEDAMKSLASLDRGTLIFNLQKFIESKSPEDRRAMYLPPDLNPEQVFYGDYLVNLGTDLSKTFSPDKAVQERLDAFNKLQDEYVFREWLINQFFARSLRSSDPKKLFKIDLQFSSEETPSQRDEIGEHHPTDVYRSVSFLRSVINDRTFDLHLESLKDAAGNDIIVAPSLRPFTQQ